MRAIKELLKVQVFYAAVLRASYPFVRVCTLGVWKTSLIVFIFDKMKGNFCKCRATNIIDPDNLWCQVFTGNQDVYGGHLHEILLYLRLKKAQAEIYWVNAGLLSQVRKLYL